MFIVISYPYLSILVTSFSTATVKFMYFSVFSLKQESSFLNSTANSFMIKW